MTRPGEWFLSEKPVEINVGRRTCTLKVRNTGDRPIQVGSHFHFFEVNAALDFDRVQAIGMHLNVPGGLAMRFEPGDEKDVELVEFGGTKRVVGFNNLVNGGLTAEQTVRAALQRARERGFKGVESPDSDAAEDLPRARGDDQARRHPDRDNKGGSRKGSKS